MKLQQIGAHQDDAYPEIGEVISLFWSHDRTLFAVVSVRTPGISWIRPGLVSRHCQRLSLYDASSRRLINSTSGLRHKILEVAFHPTESFLMIGTGEYDGGYFLEGELVQWHWKTNEWRMIAGQPAFYRIRFTSPDNVDVLISPPDEEDVESGQDAFKTFRLVSFSLADLPSDGRIPEEQLWRPLAKDMDRWEADFAPMEMYGDERKAFEEASREEVARLTGCGGNRGAIRDMLVLGTDLITIKNRPALERRRLTGELVEVRENAFSGAQVFAVDEERVLVNTDFFEPLNGSTLIHGRLLLWQVKSGKVETYLEGANPYLLSQSGDGTLLVRSIGDYSEKVSSYFRRPMGVDFLIDSDLKRRPISPLGPATQLEFITTKGSKELYHLGLEFPWPGWGKEPYPRRVLSSFGQDGVSKLLDYADKRPSAEDLHKAWHFLGLSLFCSYPTLPGEDIFGAGDLANVHPMKWVIWRHDLSQKSWLWQKQFDQRVCLLLGLPTHHAVLAGFDEGILRLLDADTGEIRDEITLSSAGLPSLPLEACLHGNEIIVGTLEGRILRFRIG